MNERQQVEIAMAVAQMVTRLGDNEQWKRLDRYLAKYERQETDKLLNMEPDPHKLGLAQGMLKCLRLIRNVPKIAAKDANHLKQRWEHLRKQEESAQNSHLFGADPDFEQLLKEEYPS